MDPVTAIGLVSNVLQFGVYAYQLIREAKEVYKSIDGSSKAASQLEAIARNLKKSCAEPIEADEPQEALELRSQCVKTAELLLAKANDLKLKDGSRRSKRDAIRKAFKARSSQQEVKDALDGLDHLTSQITHYNVVVLRKQQAELTGAIGKLLSTLDGQQHGNAEKLREMHSTILEGFAQLSARSNVLDGDGEVPGSLVKAIAALYAESKVLRRQFSVLKTLWRDFIPARHEQIPDAYIRTFKWIHSETFPTLYSTNTFSTWMRSDGGIYWMSGNAGSGKSTLMKFVSDSETTKDMLRSWSKESVLIIASFYFWKPGTEEQNSVSGLIRALLYQILRQCPSLIPIIVKSLRFPYSFPHQSGSEGDAFIPDNFKWTDASMCDALDLIFRQEDVNCKICLFIDGLDEYTGDKAMLKSFFKPLASSSRVKACVSSRPENFFVSFFEKDLQIGPRNILRLHELTWGDISTFVTDRLSELPEFKQQFAAYSDKGESFALALAEKAEGVFLWADLAVTNVSNGVLNGDSVTALKEKLQRLPTSKNLDEFFRRMLDSVEVGYREQARAIFLTCSASPDKVVDDDIDKDRFLLTLPFVVEDSCPGTAGTLAKLHSDEVKPILDLAQRRLNARCAGLVKVFDGDERHPWYILHIEDEDSSPYHLIYLRKAAVIHRAAHEFLQRSGSWCSIDGNTEGRREEWIRLQCMGAMNCLRYVPVNDSTSMLVTRLTMRFMAYLSFPAGMGTSSVLEFCELFEQTMTVNCDCSPISDNGKPLPPDEAFFEAVTTDSPIAAEGACSRFLRFVYGSFAAFFVACGPECWLQDKLEKNDAAYRPESRLLEYVALYPTLLVNLSTTDNPFPSALRRENVWKYLDHFGMDSLRASSMHLQIISSSNFYFWNSQVSASRYPSSLTPKRNRGFVPDRKEWRKTVAQRQHLQAGVPRILLGQVLMVMHSSGYAPLPSAKMLTHRRRVLSSLHDVSACFASFVFFCWVDEELRVDRYVISDFLDAGANPNHICSVTGKDDGSSSYGGQTSWQPPTVWAVVLASILESPFSPFRLPTWDEIVVHFLRKGADPCIKFKRQVFDRPMDGKGYDVCGVMDAVMQSKTLFARLSNLGLRQIRGEEPWMPVMEAERKAEALVEKVGEFLELSPLESPTSDITEEAWHSADEDLHFANESLTIGDTEKAN